MYKSN